jgi:hypothetical protein
MRTGAEVRVITADREERMVAPSCPGPKVPAREKGVFVRKVTVARCVRGPDVR